MQYSYVSFHDPRTWRSTVHLVTPDFVKFILQGWKYRIHPRIPDFAKCIMGDLGAGYVYRIHAKTLLHCLPLLAAMLVISWLSLSAQAVSYPLSYQQLTNAQVNGGYHQKHAFFFNQQGLLSKDARQLHYHVQCRSHQCNWQTIKLQYLPEPMRIEIGYDRRFQSHILARRQPFFGLFAKFSEQTTINDPVVRRRPWLGLLIPKSGLIRIDDAFGPLQQSVMHSGSYFLSSDELPTGRYPISVFHTTKQDGKEKIHDQFVMNTPLTTHLPKKATYFTIGFPTNSAASSSYGLPPIDDDLHHLLVHLSHISTTPLGTSQSTINIQNQQMAIGFNNRAYYPNHVVQPELLWMHTLSRHSKDSLAVGVSMHGRLFDHGLWQLLSTTYPKNDSSNDLPWIVHSQVQWLQQQWLVSLAAHVSRDSDQSYLQTTFKRSKNYAQFTRTTTLSSRTSTHKDSEYTLGVSLNQRTAQSPTWTAKTSNAQQSLSHSRTLRPRHQVEATVTNVTSSHPYQQRLAVKNNWQNRLAQWQLTNSFPFNDDHITWSLQAKTGLACVGYCAVMTPIQSIHRPAILYFDPSTPRRHFYWGPLDTLQSEGLSFKKKSAYSTVTQSKNTMDTTDQAGCKMPIILYPGNLVIQ